MPPISPASTQRYRPTAPSARATTRRKWRISTAKRILKPDGPRRGKHRLADARAGGLAAYAGSGRTALSNRRSRTGPLSAFRVLHALDRHGRYAATRQGVGPAWEFNYGVVPNGQVHIIAPLTFDSPAGGRSQFGYGDTELGFKYRFIDEDKNGARPMIGVYPLIELPTGNESLGLGAGYTRAYFPIWIQKSFGDWTTYGGGGYWINHGDDTSIAITGTLAGCCSGR